MMPARHRKLIVDTIIERYGRLPVPQLLDELCQAGVIDQTRCKIGAVRRRVEALVRGGGGKVKSMWQAADEFCVTYEFVRKCMYYHHDINF